MATFPALTPNARSLSLGDTPQVIHKAASGANVRFRYGGNHLDQVLSLTFNAITESDLNLIYAHYKGQEGDLIAFDLPSTVWSGYTTVPISASTFDWRYAGAFSVSPAAAPGRFNLEVELVSVVK